MVEMLRGFGNLGFSLDRLLQGADCGVGGDFEGEEVCIRMRRSGDVECDAPR